jgi:hypothetical protein
MEKRLSRIVAMSVSRVTLLCHHRNRSVSLPRLHELISADSKPTRDKRENADVIEVQQ